MEYVSGATYIYGKVAPLLVEVIDTRGLHVVFWPILDLSVT